MRFSENHLGTFREKDIPMGNDVYNLEKRPVNPVSVAAKAWFALLSVGALNGSRMGPLSSDGWLEEIVRESCAGASENMIGVLKASSNLTLG